ncbi:hypothetical protein F6V30_10130 [Oryzomonas sagensis]|uniref:Uncharacterized protein n=1 Tax=Oryzomonas sagensis TaxID=2603857 RepID=A0ABQ6TQ91_9BACT|nr:hypothetical protein [Oryzomonas sagensis]KAB0670490.1 hypothetical protein F6V30_10130 [Oryzomonas sagensis]
MNTDLIDEAIDRYVSERMTAGREHASSRFLSYAHLKCTGGEIGEFMRHVTGLTRYYIDVTKVFENPFRGIEMAFLSTMLVVAVVACWLMQDEATRLCGICVFAGTIVHGFALMRHIARKWLKSGVMIAMYEELVALVEQEEASLRG